MQLSNATLLSLLPSHLRPRSSENESCTNELSPLKARVFALARSMAAEMSASNPNLFPSFLVNPMIEGKLLPELAALEDDQLRAMLTKARDFIGELLNE